MVADAAGNDLLRVNRLGRIGVLAIFPDELASTANIKELSGCPESGSDFCLLPDMLPTESVPDAMAVGPDGSIYVGELKGFPGPTDESRIWRVSPDAVRARGGSSPDCVTVFDGGYTSIIDMTFGPDGNLYVAEFDEDGFLALEIFGSGSGGTINSCDLATLTCEEVATGIPMLTAITFDTDGSLWATRNSLIPGLAEVLQVE